MLADLLSLVVNLNEPSLGADLGDLQVSLSTAGDAVVGQRALLALVEQDAFARCAHGRGAADGPRHRCCLGHHGLGLGRGGGEVQPANRRWISFRLSTSL